MNEKLNYITKQEDWQEQYYRQNYLLIHDITAGNQKNTDALALEIFKEKLDIELTQRDLDRTYWIGQNDKDNNRHRSVNVKFIWYNDKKKVFPKKKQLKIFGISITKLRIVN